MAEVIVLGSSSKGNCYLIKTEKEHLIIEAGISFSEIEKSLGFDTSKIVGCLITHEHGDHSKYGSKYAKKMVPVFATEGTIYGIKSNKLYRKIKYMQDFQVGSFSVMPFDTEHDCYEPVGFLIEHKEFGRLLFATDTYFIKYRFTGLDHVMIECNYIDEIASKRVESGELHYSTYSRIQTSHFELERVCKFLEASCDSATKTITLLHLSNDNTMYDVVLSKVSNLNFVKNAEVRIAEKGLKYKIKKEF